MDFDELLACAKRVLHERKISRMATAGTVAAAILTDKGNVYTGVCIETPLEWASARNMPLSRPWSPQGSPRSLSLPQPEWTTAAAPARRAAGAENLSTQCMTITICARC